MKPYYEHYPDLSATALAEAQSYLQVTVTRGKRAGDAIILEVRPMDGILSLQALTALADALDASPADVSVDAIDEAGESNVIAVTILGVYRVPSGV